MRFKRLKSYLWPTVGAILCAVCAVYSDRINDFLLNYLGVRRRGDIKMDFLTIAIVLIGKDIFIYKSRHRYSRKPRKEPSLEKCKKSARIRLIVSAPAPLLLITDFILIALTDVFADFPSDYKVVYQIVVMLLLIASAIFISSIYDLVKLAAEEKRLERLRSCVKKYPLEDIVNLIEKLPNVNVRITDGENDISIGSKAEIDSDSGEPFYKRYYVRQDEFVSLWDFREALAPFAPDGQLSVTNGKRLRECCNIRIDDEPE